MAQILLYNFVEHCCGGVNTAYKTVLYPAILGKGPRPKMGKMIDLTSKLGKINNIKHNNGSKIYPQNQVVFFKIVLCQAQVFKYHTQWVIVSHK